MVQDTESKIEEEVGVLKRVQYSLLNLFLKTFIFPIIKLLWIEKVEGINNIPRSGGVIIASNHESYFDFICLSAVSPRPIRFLTAEVFYKKWWWRLIVTLTKQIKIDRYSKDKKESAKRAVRQAVRILKKGEVFGIFPEGTRSPNGKLQKAFEGVARIILMAKVPVIPVGMIGTYEIMSRYEKKPRFKKCRVKIGKALDFGERYGQQKNKEILRHITNQVMNAIAGLTDEKYGFS